ncbi:hypothetical protein [methane-oxidizing endosymbiont of Gigantopelta aegis]|uniref:hypothetical protein n=1 Tax=methane-oxidizing endosymbiont of Gigantopelta aegis TaxID=2794938 RepID=UPI0018DB32FD|nr:hypothetical protein [methane-oxidizing endosymbiont of Gigantopelta aegis]
MGDKKNNPDKDLKKSETSIDRRKLTKAGLIAPVLMSFSSRPAWAVTCTLSGMLSGNLSGPFAGCDNSALSAAYWDANRNQWGTRGSEIVNTFFGLGSNGYFNASVTFSDVYDGTATVATGVGAEHCANSVNEATFTSALLALLKEAIAGVLNVDHFGTSYPVTIINLQTQVATAFTADNTGTCSTSNMDTLKSTLAGYNNVNPYP